MKRYASFVSDEAIALIGDLVASREALDRHGLHTRLAASLETVNGLTDPVVPMRITVGDEHQGVFATLGAALAASMLLRLTMLPDHDIRHGIGRGALEVLAEEPRVEDGPAWWAARAAIEQVAAAERTAAVRGLRTAYVVHHSDGDHDPSPEEAAVNAALLLRDQSVTGLSPRSLSVLRGLLAGTTQRDLADDLGISPSAVSQRVRADGLGAIVAAHALMKGLP